MLVFVQTMKRFDPSGQAAPFKSLLRRLTVFRVKWKAVAPCLLLMLTLVCLPRSIAAPRLIFDGPGGNGTAAIISPLEKDQPTWNIDGYVSSLEDAGYSVEVVADEAASLAFFRTELANYNLIILRLDSFYYEGFSYFCAGDSYDSFNPSQRTQYQSQYATELAAHEVSITGPCLGFSMAFILNSYQKHSFNGLVIAYGFGAYELAASFINNGAAAFISYDSPANLSWGRFDSYAETLVTILAEGNTVRDAVAQFYLLAMRGHGLTATWPSIYWVGDGNYTI